MAFNVSAKIHVLLFVISDQSKRMPSITWWYSVMIRLGQSTADLVLISRDQKSRRMGWNRQPWPGFFILTDIIREGANPHLYLLYWQSFSSSNNCFFKFQSVFETETSAKKLCHLRACSGLNLFHLNLSIFNIH